MKLLNFLFFGGIVYRLGRQPFTLESRVRFPVPLPFFYLLFGGIVYRLGRQPLTLENWVRFPVPLPMRSQSPRSSASGAGRLFFVTKT